MRGMCYINIVIHFVAILITMSYTIEKAQHSTIARYSKKATQTYPSIHIAATTTIPGQHKQ